MATIMNVDGTYPLDGSQWSILTPLTVQEAADFLGVPVPDDPERHYLLLNKGYVVVDEHRRVKSDPDRHDLGLHFAEMLTSGEVGKRWPEGTWAVYVGDGRYYLLESRRSCPCCKSKMLFHRYDEYSPEDGEFYFCERCVKYFIPGMRETL